MATVVVCKVMVCLALKSLMAFWRLLPRTALLVRRQKLAGHGLHISCSPLDEKCSTVLEEE